MPDQLLSCSHSYTVPIQARGKHLTPGCRQHQLPGDQDPPAAVFFYSRDRGGVHPEQHLASYAGLMQADAYAGFNRLYEANRKPGPIIEAACWAQPQMDCRLHLFQGSAPRPAASIALRAVGVALPPTVRQVAEA